MLTLQITKDQVFTLIDQLSLNEQQEVLQYLVEKAREVLYLRCGRGLMSSNSIEIFLTSRFKKDRLQEIDC